MLTIYLVTSIGSITDEVVSANLAVVSFDGSILVTGIRSDSGLKARWWDGSSWSEEEAPDFNCSSEDTSISHLSQFTAIATNSDRRVYGIVDGVIYDWRFDHETPLEWECVGIVYVTLPE